jgi:hypothetical protein
MKKIVNKLIDESVKGVDTYSHNGSTWLIFTESKQWVIELTESKTLWYNYNFFKGMFAYASMDVVENQHYITQWVEDNIINKVKDTILEQNITEGEVEGIIEMAVKENSFSFVRMKVDCENVIENGVKETMFNRGHKQLTVKNIIENGVRDISPMTQYTDWQVEEIIENGVKNIRGIENDRSFFIEDTLEEGIKLTGRIHKDYTKVVEYLIENGIKETKTPGNGDIASTDEWMKENNSTSYPKMIDDVIENGVKETLNTEYMPQVMVEDTIQNGIKKTILRQNITDGNVDTIIETGIKETQPLPDQSGELIGYGNYYHGKEDRTKAFYNYLEETIKFGVKENIG